MSAKIKLVIGVVCSLILVAGIVNAAPPKRRKPCLEDQAVRHKAMEYVVGLSKGNWWVGKHISLHHREEVEEHYTGPVGMAEAILHFLCGVENTD